LRAVVFFAAVFRLAVDFFFAVDFFAADFRGAAFFLDPERELERDDERVRAGMAAASSGSMEDSSTAASSSATIADGSLHEPRCDVVSDASPVPLQSSWVIN
jgi:hypothetical protein